MFDPVESLESAVRARVPGPVNFYVQYLETQRFEDENYEKGLAEIVRRTVSGERLDLIIVAAFPALRFALKHRDEWVPGVPIVFAYVHPGRITGQKMWPGVTGVTVNVDMGATVDLALQIHPDAKTVAIITNTSEFERYWLSNLHADLRRRHSEVNEIDLVGLPTAQLLERVAALPPQTVILFTIVPQESIQSVIGVYDIIGAVGQRLPTYCIFPKLCVNHGGIGGADYDEKEQTAWTAKLAARVLSGERPEDIPVVYGTSSQIRLDWRQLRRWDIPDSALPPGSVVLYRQPTLWDRYKIYVLAGIAIICVQALLIAALLWQRARRRAAAEALQEVGGRLIHAHEEERARIARDLHDDFSQRLALQCIELTNLRKNLPESESEERVRALEILERTKEISADMRSLSHRLHPSRLELVGLVPALSGLCEEVTAQQKVEVHFTAHDCRLNLSKDVELCLFRTAQEALSNVVKHSDASSADVELSVHQNTISLRIADSGKGFNPNSKNQDAGIGLIGMRERLRLVDGKLSVRSEPLRGTEVLAEIPLPNRATDEWAMTHPAEEMQS